MADNTDLLKRIADPATDMLGMRDEIIEALTPQAGDNVGLVKRLREPNEADWREIIARWELERLVAADAIGALETELNCLVDLLESAEAALNKAAGVPVDPAAEAEARLLEPFKPPPHDCHKGMEKLYPDTAPRDPGVWHLLRAGKDGPGYGGADVEVDTWECNGCGVTVPVDKGGG